MQETKKAIDHEEAKQLAREYVEQRLAGYAYPIAPLDEYGCPEPFEPGCVPWVSIAGITITDAYIDDQELDENGCLSVFVDADLFWDSEEETEEEEETLADNATFDVCVGYENDKLCCFDYDRVD